MKIAHRFQVRASAQRVMLLGEVGDWRTPIALDRAADLDLPAGLYQYKLVADGEWQLDDANPRTRSAGGVRNNVLAIDAAPEPFLFAAAPPWLEPLDTGGVRVLMGARKPHEAPALAFSEDDGKTFTTVTLTSAFEEDEHTFFSALLPASAPRLVIRLGDFATEWTRPTASDRVPTWWKEAALYTIFVDRFRPAVDRAAWDVDPGDRRAHGGHLEGIRRSLDEIRELGFDALYLTPVHVGASSHRYDLVDPLAVDPALGGDDAYRALVRDARARGMRIIQDFSFVHAGRGFPAYEDVLANGRASRFAAWFVWRDDALVHYGRRTDGPLLDLEHPDVQALAIDAVEHWAKRGVSGLRLDMTAEVPLALGRRIRERFRQLVPDGVVIGEVVPQHVWRWRQERVVDAATDFAFHDALTRLTCNVHPSVATVFEGLARTDLLRGGDARSAAVRFASTHDHPRLATLAARAGTLARLPVAYALLATWPGVPMLLYGEELGLRGDAGDRDLEDVWPDRAPRPWSSSGDRALYELVRALFRARASCAALRGGSLAVLYADDSVLVFRRERAGEIVDVALNFSAEEKLVEIEDTERPRLVPIAGTGVADGMILRLPPHGMLIAHRERTLGKAILPAEARRNLLIRDKELADGRVVVESRPSRFFFSITERCNLRCAHCITHAPELTQSGAARTMTPAVLDALRDDLGFADYFAFVHGGESLTTPLLYDVLAAIRAARGAEPYVAHLLTNGMLLTPRSAERLVRAGVSSISVSLDGATSATNDSIRIGSRLAAVKMHLEDVLAWRRGEGVDVRIGLSFVILQQNVHELGAFVDLAADLGVDWVKLEEGVPATAFAARSLVACGAPAMRAAIERTLDRGRARGLVMVDHTIDRPVWRCRLDNETAAFLAADEHANRGPIHPCRTPWETACVEPNGDIRARDFFGPILGNVTAIPLRELWNMRLAHGLREQAVATRLCGAGPVTCLPV